MPPRKRNKENSGLPKLWRYYHGAFWYRVPPGAESFWDGRRQFRLGATLVEAHRTFAERMAKSDTHALHTIGDALDRYALEVIPLKAVATHKEQQRIVRRLKETFGSGFPADFKPTHAYRYRDIRVQASGLTSANHDLEVLSHAFTKMIEWGMLHEHPMTHNKFRKTRPPARDRYVEDWEIAAALSLKPRRKKGSVSMCQAYIRLKLATGLRRTDLLRLQVSDLKSDGIHVKPSKTAKTTGRKSIRERTPELDEIVQACLAARPVDISPFLFCTAKGKSYLKADGNANGFDSVWQRFMDRVMAETEVKERFWERDLRSKAATDAEDLGHAQALLDHASPELTKRVYRLKPERVKPGKVRG